MTDNIRNEVVTIHGLQEALKMLPVSTETFPELAEDVLIYLLKMLYRNICNFLTNIFFYFLRSGVTVTNNVSLPEKNYRMKKG
jgi:hypothetical protein